MPNIQKPPFLQQLLQRHCITSRHMIRQAHVLQVWYSFPFGSLVRCKHIVHLILVQGGAEHSGDCTQRSYPLVLEAESDQLCVPAKFGLNCWTSCPVAALLSQSGINVGHLRLVQLHQNLPQHFRRNHVADVFGLFCQNHVADVFFDDALGHGNHSGELLLLVGCIVNFFVSYLICMFQDSVPAGSYNDPFLSSVIPMVTPTWCHRANWGNPSWGQCRLTWIPNHTF